MVRENVDVIVAGPPPSAVAARKASRTIPIVMGNVPDPVALGLVASLARPGGNVTGVSSQTSALVGKQFEVLKAIAPAAKRFGVLYNGKNPSSGAFREAANQAATSMRVALVESRANEPGELGAAVQRLAREGVQAVVVPADPMILGARGALLSYAPDIVENFRMATVYVDRILKGAKPAELPVEQASRFEMVINLKTAKALGLAIPQSLLLRADRVVQ